jgi:glycosyltransferase involved in cell wall biosynthesis
VGTISPKVSVVLPIYNGARYLAEAIESVLGQTYPHFEVVAINDGSRDRSNEIVGRYLASGRVKYIEQSNQGVAGARNAGIARSSGEFIALLDQDDVWLPDKLEKQVAFMDAHPEAALVHARVSCIDGAGLPMNCKGWIYVGADACGLCAEQLLRGNRIAPLTVLIRRSCLEQVGVFEPAFEPADDWHLWLRMAVRFPLGFLDSVVGMYRVHDANESKNLLKMKSSEIAVMEFFRSSYPKHVRRMNRQAIESKLIAFYEEAARLQLGKGRPGEAEVLHRRALEMKLRAPWYYAARVMSVIPERLRRAIGWYWYRVRSLIGQHRG